MNVRRLAGIAALCAAASAALAIPSAGAQEVSYGAGSDGQAFNLSLFGQGLTVGQTHSDVGSAPEAQANGAGIANPLFPVGVTEAAATTAGESVDTGQQCEGELPAIPGIVLAAACSSSAATVSDNGLPSSSATAGIVEPLQLNPVGAVLETPLSDVVDDVQQGITPLLDALGEVLGPIDDAAGLGLEDTVNDLVNALLDGAPLATVQVGTSQVSSAVTAEGVSTVCSSTGATIEVLDLPAVGEIDPDPIITITVGEAGTAVAVDGESGDATPAVQPALVTVSAPTLLPEDVVVEVGQTIEIPLPDPFGTSTISVADGETGTDENGDTFARASAVSLDLLPGLQGGIQLDLADCASVAGAEVTPASTPTTTPTTVPELARTGGSSPNGWALAATVGLAGLAAVLLRRSRTTV